MGTLWALEKVPSVFGPYNAKMLQTQFYPALSRAKLAARNVSHTAP